MVSTRTSGGGSDDEGVTRGRVIVVVVYDKKSGSSVETQEQERMKRVYKTINSEILHRYQTTGENKGNNSENGYNDKRY